MDGPIEGAVVEEVNMEFCDVASTAVEVGEGIGGTVDRWMVVWG